MQKAPPPRQPDGDLGIHALDDLSVYSDLGSAVLVDLGNAYCPLQSVTSVAQLFMFLGDLGTLLPLETFKLPQGDLCPVLNDLDILTLVDHGPR